LHALEIRTELVLLLALPTLEHRGADLDKSLGLDDGEDEGW
jgi:hypothetical protein